jgi:hypothetical protein
LGLWTVSDPERGVHRTAHQDTDRLLADALGLTEPTPIVAGLTRNSAGASCLCEHAALAVPTPRELPADVGTVRGRELELAELDLLLPAVLGHGCVRAPRRRARPAESFFRLCFCPVVS